MGVQQFLAKLLEPNSAGREIDLRQYSEIFITEGDNCCIDDDILDLDGQNNDGNEKVTDPKRNHHRRKRRQRRSLRMAVDVSAWIHRACQGFGDILADERHLDNYGRAQLWKEQQQHNGQENSNERSQNSNSSGKQQQQSLEQQQKIHKFVKACTDFVVQRLEKLQEVTPHGVLVVLDGIAPPIKRQETQRRKQKRQQAIRERDAAVVAYSDQQQVQLERRLKAFRRAGAGQYYGTVVDALIVALRSCQIPFLVAPYEADGQLASLSEQGLIDLIITEDSDLIAATGCATPILYKIMMTDSRRHSQQHPRKQQGQEQPELNNGKATLGYADDDLDKSFFRGQLVRRQDLGATRGLNLMDFTPVMLATLFVATGCDYCPSLPGIGIKTANRIVRLVFFHEDTNDNKHAPSAPSTAPPLESMFRLLYRETRQDKRTLTAEFKEKFEYNFMAAIIMFRHAVVFHPVTGRCIIRNYREWDSELTSYPPYAALVQSFSKLTEIVGTLPEPPIVACLVAEGWIHLSTKQLRDTGMNVSAPQQSLPRHVQQFISTSTTSAEARSQDINDTSRTDVDQSELDLLLEEEDEELLGTQQEQTELSLFEVNGSPNSTLRHEHEKATRDAEEEPMELFDTQPASLDSPLILQDERRESQGQVIQNQLHLREEQFHDRKADDSLHSGSQYDTQPFHDQYDTQPIQD